MNLELLRELDLSEGQVKVYEAILQLGNTGVNGIQEKTGIERRNIYDIVNKLIEKGFVTYTEENKKRTYQCTHPNFILEQIKQKYTQLDQLEKQIPQVKDLFSATKTNIRAEVIRGNEGMKALLNEALEHKESYWMGGNSGIEQNTSLDMKNWFKHWTKKRIEKKHKMYDLVDFGTYLEGLEPWKESKHKALLYERRELPQHLASPMVIIIFGNKVIQVLWSKQTFAVVLESEELQKSFMKYFQYFWNNESKTYYGIDGFKQYLTDILKEKQTVYFIGAKALWLDPRLKDFLPEFEKQRQKLGITFKHIFDYEVKEQKPEILKLVGKPYKFLPKEYSSPTCIDMFGDYVVTFAGVKPGELYKEPIQFVMKSKNLAKGYRKFFDFMWDHIAEE